MPTKFLQRGGGGLEIHAMLPISKTFNAHTTRRQNKRNTTPQHTNQKLRVSITFEVKIRAPLLCCLPLRQLRMTNPKSNCSVPCLLCDPLLGQSQFWVVCVGHDVRFSSNRHGPEHCRTASVQTEYHLLAECPQNACTHAHLYVCGLMLNACVFPPAHDCSILLPCQHWQALH